MDVRIGIGQVGRYLAMGAIGAALVLALTILTVNLSEMIR